MNILFVEYKVILGGGQKYLLSLLEKLESQSITSIVICQPGSAIGQILRKTDIKIEFIRFTDIRRNYSLFYLFKILSSHIYPTLKLVQRIKRYRINLVVANGTFSLLVSLLSAKFSKVPIIWVVHNTLLTARAKFVIYWLVKLSDKIIVVTEAIKREFESLWNINKDKITVIHNGVDLNILDKVHNSKEIDDYLNKCKSALIIGTVSRLSKEKGIDYLIHAVPRIIRSQPDVQFVIVGDGPDEPQLKAMIHQLNLDKFFSFVGFKENVMNWINIMDIFVLPSLNEALPFAILEAMALAKPVIATDVGGNYELVESGKNGYLIPPRDSRALADAILKLCSDKEKRYAMGNYGQKKVIEKFRLDFSVKKTNQVFESLVRFR